MRFLAIKDAGLSGGKCNSPNDSKSTKQIRSSHNFLHFKHPNLHSRVSVWGFLIGFCLFVQKTKTKKGFCLTFMFGTWLMISLESHNKLQGDLRKKMSSGNQGDIWWAVGCEMLRWCCGGSLLLSAPPTTTTTTWAGIRRCVWDCLLNVTQHTYKVCKYNWETVIIHIVLLLKVVRSISTGVQCFRVGVSTFQTEGRVAVSRVCPQPLTLVRDLACTGRSPTLFWPLRLEPSAYHRVHCVRDKGPNPPGRTTIPRLCWR